jgi:hypothetical protein
MELELQTTNDETLGFLEEYGSEPIELGEEAGEPKQPPKKHQNQSQAQEMLTIAVAMTMQEARKVPGIVAKLTHKGGVLIKKCSESEVTRRLILKCKESEMAKKCRESELGEKVYKKVEDSELGKYAKKRAADNPQKAKQQLALAVVVLFFVIRWLFFGNSIPPSIPIVTEEGIIPNVLFVGTRHSGVKEVSEWLYSNTNVCPPKVLEGKFERPSPAVGFFNRPGPTPLGLPWYAKRFKQCQDAELVMDATPEYFHMFHAIHKFYHDMDKHFINHLKIVITVREPIEREYWEYMTNGHQSLRSFESYLSDVAAPCYLGEKPGVANVACPVVYGHYEVFMNKWFDIFPRKNILVLSFDELESAPKQALGRLEAFLGYTKIKRGASLVMPDSSKSSSNGKTIQASNLPSCAAQQVLQTIFEDWNEEFYALMQKKKGLKIEQRPFPEFELGMCKE